MPNTAPLSGTRDFLALEVLRRNYVISVIEDVYQSYGFEPLQTPALERLDTLLGKYGDEGDQLIFRVLKRGEELDRALAAPDGEALKERLSDAGLRYDLTVPLARVMAEHRNDLPRIYKRYQIQPVYRAERPARGRFREFYQCDVDIVGSTSPVADAEVIGAVAHVLQRLSFRGSEQFLIRLNHRGVLNGLMEVMGIAPVAAGPVLVAIDKLDKIGLDGVRQELIARGLADETAARLLEILGQGLEAGSTPETALDWLDGLLAASAVGRESVANLRAIVPCLANGPAAEHLRIDPFIVRGLSYYTGAIFEIAFPGLSGSGGGGGRYDNLVGMFSGQGIPACGFSLGLERLLLIMEERGMFPERLSGQPQALVTLFDQTTIGPSIALATRLREAGLHVDLYPEPGGYGRQFKYAGQRGIRYALLLSPREIDAGVVAIKDLAGGEQVDVPAGEVAAWLAERL